MGFPVMFGGWRPHSGIGCCREARLLVAAIVLVIDTALLMSRQIHAPARFGRRRNSSFGCRSAASAKKRLNRKFLACFEIIAFAARWLEHCSRACEEADPQWFKAK